MVANGGGFESPVSGGEFAQVGDWKVRVIEVIPDATALVLAENQFNDEPEDGKQFFMVTLEAEYTGTASATFWVDMSWSALGPSSVAYSSFEDSCGVTPGNLSDAGEVFPGGVITGNACWSLTAGDAEELLMFLESSFSFDDDRAFYSLAGTG
jgi:hypothetical protein